MSQTFRELYVDVSTLEIDDLGAAPAHVEMIDRMLETRTPHEPDFRAFSLFERSGCTFFDIGANIGNSALSVHFVQPTWTVVSFEPNTALNPLYDRVRHEFHADGADFHLFNVGLGAAPGDIEFFMPRVGTWNVVGEASFDLDHFRDPHVAARLSSYSSTGEWKLLRTLLPIVRFDDYSELKPILDKIGPQDDVFVKIDVEGFEENVLIGMTKFIESHKPVFMIENSPEDSVLKILSKYGYRSYNYVSSLNRLSPVTNRSGSLNLFYLHEDFHPEQRDGWHI